jgi:putative flavoprotein involved in K+ transport
LPNHCAIADLKLARLLDTIDDWVECNDTCGEARPPERFAPTRVEQAPRLSLNLADGRIGTVIFATGYRPDYGWLHVPVLDHKGRLRHHGGIVDTPGLYALGLNFMRRRKSSFMHGAEDDTRDLSAHLAAYLRDSLGRSSIRAAG